MCFFFFFNDTATTEIYTLSLHDALPILRRRPREYRARRARRSACDRVFSSRGLHHGGSDAHQALNEDARGHDRLRIEAAQFYDLAHLDHGGLRRGRHDRAEVARALAEAEVAPAV